MNTRTTAIVAIAISALLFCGGAFAAPDKTGTSPVTAALQSLYWQGHEALGRGEWDLALQRFGDLERRLRQSEPASVDAAIYWQAYALTRAGRVDEAVVAIKRLRTEYPKSRWNGDAARLLTRDGTVTDSNARLAAELKTGGSDAQAEAALEMLMSQPAAQAIPKLVALLQGQHSPQFKKRALFVLSQIDDAGAVAQVAAVARGNDPVLSAEAVRMLGVSGAADELRKVYVAVRDVGSKGRVIKALGVAASSDPIAEDALAEVARNDADAGLRATALQALGAAGSVEVLTEMAGSNTDLPTRQAAIKALGATGGRQRLLALYPKVLGTPALRDEVLKGLLAANGERVLLDLYRKAGSPEEKQAVLRVLQEAGGGVNDKK